MQMIKDIEIRQLKCEICQTDFVCNGNNGNNCWCMDLDPKIIDKKINDCICQRCLSQTGASN